MKVTFTGINSYAIEKPSSNEIALLVEADNSWKKDLDKFTPYLNKNDKPKIREQIMLIAFDEADQTNFYLNSHLLRPNDKNLSLFENFANIIKKVLGSPIMANSDIEKEIKIKMYSEELLELITNSIKRYLK